MPILHERHVIGAVGVSGASSAPEDQELAQLGADALADDTRANRQDVTGVLV